MKYRKLGKTGLMVSEIGLGGEWLERHNAQECKEVIDCCKDHGINTLDCWMSEPNVRTNIGSAIKHCRDQWIVQGHIGATWQGNQYVRTRSMSHTREAFEDLLTRFQTDYMDVGVIHYVDGVEEWKQIIEGEFYAYALELKKKGAIRHIGLSTHNPRIAKLAVESGLIETLMFSINPAYDLVPPSQTGENPWTKIKEDPMAGVDPLRVELYRLCEEKDIAISVMKGFAGARLFDAKRSPLGVALTPLQCLHYCLTRPGVASVMVGYDTPQQVLEAVSYETASDEEKDYASVLARASGRISGGQCTYCGHCAPCPNEIDIAMVNKLYDLAVMQPQVPDSIRSHYDAMSANASSCIACGGCEERCPFGVPIIQRMKDAAKLLG